MLWVSLGLVVVFGGATLLLRDETFIKWKPTVLYWLFASTLFVSARFFGKNLIRAMLSQAQMNLPEPLWTKLNLAWAGFFAAMGVLNLWVAFNFSTDTWGQLQALRQHGPDAGFHHWPGTGAGQVPARGKRPTRAARRRPELTRYRQIGDPHAVCHRRR
jgi:hypothetical protein